VRDGFATAFGGGIFNEGNLTLTGCDVIDNAAGVANSPNPSYGGGGIENRGTLTLWGCLVAHNSLAGTTSFVNINNGGGGIDNNGGEDSSSSNPPQLNIYFSTLTDNQSVNAGALRTSDGTLTMVGSVITGNTATGIVGGAMSLARSVDNITGCIISDNHITSPGGSGGAFSNDSSSTTLNGCLIANNSASLFGGAIDVATVQEAFSIVSSVTANDCVFTGNECLSAKPTFFGLPAGNGGAFAVLDGTSLSLNGCLVTGNQASTDGGAIWVGNVINKSGSNVTVTDSALVSNSAGRNGGAIFVEAAASLVLDAALVSFNHAGGHGGGLYLTTIPATFDISTAVIANNSPDNVFIAS
jgi:predicted outer membrane repeat protein